MRNFEPSHGICPFPRSFYVFAEFCGIRYWTLIEHILLEFRPPYCMYTWFHHEIHDCHSGSDGRNTENIELSLSEILPVNLVDRQTVSFCQLNLPATNTRTFGRVQGPQKNYYMWKICRGEPRNLANWPVEFEKIAAENCGPYFEYTVTPHWTAGLTRHCVGQWLEWVSEWMLSCIVQEILDRTGYSLDVTTGQRKYGGPPPGMSSTPPGPGHEVPYHSASVAADRVLFGLA